MPSIAVLGTGSDVGKSTIAAGICRVLANGGRSVVPFKAQNMSNNSHPALLPDGSGYGEIGVAQAIQAQACRQIPRVEMNPVLLKSGGQRESDGAFLCSVHVLGKHYATEDYGELKNRTSTLMDLVVGAHNQLAETNDVVVLEGAGSCTELNLMDRDIVNIPLVRKLQCPWILVANIDPGGVFAQIVGTKACLTKSDWDLCAGIIVNKLRGEAKYFEPGPQMLEAMVGKPVYVIPYLYNINIAEEDGMGLDRKISKEQNYPDPEGSDVVVVCYPHLSMMDDILPIELDPRIKSVQWRRQCIPKLLKREAIIILPGSRQSRSDLEWLVSTGWKDVIQNHAQAGGRIIGLCGGYQMLGTEVCDPVGVEAGGTMYTAGLGILPVQTILEPPSEKIIRPQTAKFVSNGAKVKGFEIHCGRTKGTTKPLLQLENGDFDGAVEGNVFGTYLHGILNSKEARDLLLNLNGPSWIAFGAENCDPLDKLAEHLEKHGLDYETLTSMVDKTSE